MDDTTRFLKLYRLFLRLYPRPFREQFGPEILQVIGDDWHHRPDSRGTNNPLFFWPAAFLNLLTTALKEHGDNFNNPLKQNRYLHRLNDALSAGFVHLCTTGVVYLIIGYAYLNTNNERA